MLRPRGTYVCDQALEEYGRASRKFSPFNSAHEGYAVLREEVDELWDEVKRNGPVSRMREEAIQIAAMAIRFVIDVCDSPTPPSEPPKEPTE